MSSDEGRGEFTSDMRDGRGEHPQHDNRIFSIFYFFNQLLLQRLSKYELFDPLIFEFILSFPFIEFILSFLVNYGFNFDKQFLIWL